MEEYFSIDFSAYTPTKAGEPTTEILSLDGESNPGPFDLCADANWHCNL